MIKSNFMKSRRMSRCWVCRLPTRYIELNFGAPLHRRTCCPIADRAYWKTTVIGAPDLKNRFQNWRLYRFMKRFGEGKR